MCLNYNYTTRYVPKSKAIQAWKGLKFFGEKWPSVSILTNRGIQNASPPTHKLKIGSIMRAKPIYDAKYFGFHACKHVENVEQDIFGEPHRVLLFGTVHEDSEGQLAASHMIILE